MSNNLLAIRVLYSGWAREIFNLVRIVVVKSTRTRAAVAHISNRLNDISIVRDIAAADMYENCIFYPSDLGAGEIRIGCQVTSQSNQILGDIYLLVVNWALKFTRPSLFSFLGTLKKGNIWQ